MTNYEIIIEDLKKWEADEQFYRDYYLTAKDDRTTSELLFLSVCNCSAWLHVRFN